MQKTLSLTLMKLFYFLFFFLLASRGLANEPSVQWVYMPLKISHHASTGKVTRADIYRIPVYLYNTHFFSELSWMNQRFCLDEQTASPSTEKQANVNLINLYGISIIPDPHGEVWDLITIDFRKLKKPPTESMHPLIVANMALECVRRFILDSNKNSDPEDPRVGKVKILTNTNNAHLAAWESKLNSEKVKQTIFE